MDIKYILISSLASEVALDLLVKVVKIINEDFLNATEVAYYQFMQNYYYQINNQLPPNAIQVRDAVNNIYQHTLIYIHHDANSLIVSINTLAFGLHIITLINALVLILNLLGIIRTGGSGAY